MLRQPLIIHSQPKPIWANSPLYPGKIGPYGVNGEEKAGEGFLECSVPLVQRPEVRDEPSRSSEVTITCRGSNVFSNTPLGSLLKKRNRRTLLIAGIPTDYAVSTTVRSAHDLAIDGKWRGPGHIEDPFKWLHTDGAGVYGRKQHHFGGNQQVSQEDLVDYAIDTARIILIGDGTRCFGKGGVHADMIHRVHVESLSVFAKVTNTAIVLRQLYQDDRWKTWTFS